MVALFEQAAARGEIASWAVPERIELADVIPKTRVGKIDKKSCASSAAAAHLARLCRANC
ncbi:MAG: hypothetical protein QF375_03595 [Arenicellales bacterium]|nr:hypothetical protein [Arenicellales bacterium]